MKWLVYMLICSLHGVSTYLTIGFVKAYPDNVGMTIVIYGAVAILVTHALTFILRRGEAE